MGLSASAQKTMYLDSIQNVCTVGSTQSISLRVKSFNTILGFQGSVAWDTAVLKYSGISYGTSAITLNASNMVLTNTSKGNVGFLWFDQNVVGQTVIDTTILFTLKFTVVKTIIGKTNIKFSNIPTSLEIDVIDPITGLPGPVTDTVTFAGSVGFLNVPTISKNGSTLTAVASGTPSSYQWNLNGSPISGATKTTLTNANVKGASYTVTANYTNGCSLTSTPLLPLSLRGFTGYYKAGSSVLSWNTVNETNVAYYALQRSTNGKDYVTIKQIAANNALRNNYGYNDALSTTGKVYYRLQIVEKNDVISYSNTVAIVLNSALSLSVYPNPVASTLSLQLQNSKTETVNVLVVDMLGKVLKQQQAQLNAGINNVALNVATLSRGSYIVLVKGETTQQQQFIKY